MNQVQEWITKESFQEKHQLFSDVSLRNLILRRKKNGFSMCCKLVHKKALINERLFAQWMLEYADTDKEVA